MTQTTKEVQTYDLTIDDLRAYLASKNSADEVGIPENAWECLGARAMHSKYDTLFAVYNRSFRVREVSFDECALERAIEDILESFDDIADADRKRFSCNASVDEWPAVTKAELEDNPDFAILFVPEKQWSNPGSLEGEWLYSFWNSSEGHWDFESR